MTLCIAAMHADTASILNCFLLEKTQAVFLLCQILPDDIEVQVEVVASLFNDLQSHKPSGPDSIPLRLKKTANNLISMHHLRKFNFLMTEKSYVVPCSFKKVVNIHFHAANCNVDDTLMYQTSDAFQRDLNILFQWSVDWQMI